MGGVSESYWELKCVCAPEVQFNELQVAEKYDRVQSGVLNHSERENAAFFFVGKRSCAWGSK